MKASNECSKLVPNVDFIQHENGADDDVDDNRIGKSALFSVLVSCVCVCILADHSFVCLTV